MMGIWASRHPEGAISGSFREAKAYGRMEEMMNVMDAWVWMYINE